MDLLSISAVYVLLCIALHVNLKNYFSLLITCCASPSVCKSISNLTIIGQQNIVSLYNYLQIVTTVFPFPNFFASANAATTFVPLDIPHMIPSFDASSLAVVNAC